MADPNAPFAGLDESALQKLAPGGAVRSYARNVVVVSEGDATERDVEALLESNPARQPQVWLPRFFCL